VTGSVALADWTGSMLGVPLTLALYNGTTLVETQSTTLQSSGAYGVWFSATGGIQLQAKPQHFLSIRRTASLSATQSNHFDWSFAYNGDGDGSNSIGFGDLGIVLANWGTQSADADYNHDGTVGLADLGLVLVNFGVTGN